MTASITKKKILLVGEGVTYAHILRLLCIVNVIDNPNFEFYFASSPLFRQTVESRNIPFFELYTIESEVFLKRLAYGRPVYRKDEIERYINEEFVLFNKLCPDLVIGDFRLTLGITAPVCNIPYINIIHAHWHKNSSLRFPAPQHPFERLLGTSLYLLLFRALLPGALRSYLRPFIPFFKKYGLAAPSSLRELYSLGTAAVFPDYPDISPIENISSNCFYMGPIIAEPMMEEPEWIRSIPRNNPIIYISPGSSGYLPSFENAVKALADTGWTLIIATSGRLEIRTQSNNIYYEKYLPGRQATAIADCVICNGGSGTVYQAINAGTPILCLPSSMDQYFIANQVQRLGLGVCLRSVNLNHRNIVQSVTILLKKQKYSSLTGNHPWKRSPAITPIDQIVNSVLNST